MEILYKRLGNPVTFVATVGGLPYHITEDDALYEEALVAGANAPTEPAPSSPPPIQITSMSFAQLLVGLVAEGWITAAEGRNWRDNSVLPPPAANLIASLPTDLERFAAETKALRPSVVLRNDPLLQSLATLQNKTPQQIDTFFNTYGSL